MCIVCSWPQGIGFHGEPAELSVAPFIKYEVGAIIIPILLIEQNETSHKPRV